MLEKPERQMYTLVQQLNAIRNKKAEARREQAEKKRKEVEKRKGEEEAWRGELQKERRKRAIQQKQAESNRAMKKGKYG